MLAQDESLKDLIRLGINQSDAVTAVSNDLIQETRELLDIDKPIDLTYNFVDKRVYYPRECSFASQRFCGTGRENFDAYFQFPPG